MPMKRLCTTIGLFICVGILLTGCGTKEIPTSSEGEKLYHNIGETFEFIGSASELPFEVKVKDIWIEDGKEHEAYIEEHVRKPDGAEQVMYITYEVENKGDEPFAFTDDELYPHNDLLPNFLDPVSLIKDVDVIYPENAFIEASDDLDALELEPHDKIELTAAVITTEASTLAGAFIWEFQEEIPEVVFTQAQAKRKDQVGVYDLEEKLYMIDHKDYEMSIIFHSIEQLTSEEEAPVERVYEDSSFLVMDVAIENSGKKSLFIQDAFPEIQLENSRVVLSSSFIKEGEQAPIEDDVVKKGENVHGKIYYEVENNSFEEHMIEHAQLYYPYAGFKDYPIYFQWVNYNLAND